MSRLRALALLLAVAPIAGLAVGRAPVAVEAITVKRQALVDSVSAVGELRSNQSVVLRPEIDGRISEIRFQEGAPIAEGELLVRLDDSIQRAELAEARARLGFTRRSYRIQEGQIA